MGIKDREEASLMDREISLTTFGGRELRLNAELVRVVEDKTGALVVMQDGREHWVSEDAEQVLGKIRTTGAKQ